MDDKTITIELDKFNQIKESCLAGKELLDLKKPLSKEQIRELRRLVQEHFKSGYTNYLRLITIYTDTKDEHLSIFINKLYSELTSD